MRTIALENHDSALREIINLISQEPLVVTEKGKPLAAIVGIDQDTIEALALGNNPDFLAIIARSRESYRRHGGISLDEIRRELEES